MGGLLNVTFSSEVERMVAVIALKEGQVRIIQDTMLDSLLPNHLLVIDLYFVLGGYNRVQETFN